MYTLNELIKASKKPCQGRSQKLCVLGDCSTQFLSRAIKGYAFLDGLSMDVLDADYDQITEQILDEGSALYKFQPDIVVIYICSEKLFEEFCTDPAPHSFAEKKLALIKAYHERISQKCGAKILQFNFAEPSDRIFGNFGAKTPVSFIFQLRKLNYLLQELMAEEKNVFPVDLLSIQSRIGYDSFFPSVQYHSAKLTIDLNCLPEVAKNVIDVIKAMNGYRKKCVILDLDNTLWGGNVGDCDLGELEIGSVGRGHAFSNFQRYIKQLKERGIILAVCSKNNEEAAKKPFECLEDMELKLSDIIIFTANWEDKASNIRNIISSLNISADSVVFIDDNPFERNAVKSLIPEIAVPEMPEDPADFVSVLKSYNYFETSSYSADDKMRTEQYRTEFRRKEDLSCFEDYGSYLESLDMQAVCAPFDQLHFARIAEFSQRSNQFNLRTVRYTEEDIKRIAEDPDHLTLYFTLKDKYGSYGLISAVIMKKVSADTLFIDTWILSCRVLKRGMEEFIINSMIRTAAENGFSYVEAEYVPTAKNGMVKRIYPDHGFEEIGNDRFRVKVTDHAAFPCHISQIRSEAVQ